MYKVVQLLLLTFLLHSCALFKPEYQRKSLKIRHEVEHSSVFSKGYTGFTLLDPASGKTLADVNGDKYFTPASNAKILTLAVCLKTLGDSVPAFIWFEDKSTISISPIGDPTFLHPKFQAWQSAFNQLQHTPKQVAIDTWHPYLPALGPGWAWDDAESAFSAERSYFPVYGNLKRIFADSNGTLQMHPAFWQKYLNVEDFWPDSILQIEDNKVLSNGKLSTEAWLPVRNAEDFLDSLLLDTLKREFSFGFPGELERIDWVHPPYRYSTPLDTVLRRMMHQSDNFIAEQMLLVCAEVMDLDRNSSTWISGEMLDSTLSALPQRPKWVDGSGLSRYNLMTPQSLVRVLENLLKSQSRERLFSLFPAGGVSGTITGWYGGKDGKPYVFAKTGSMSGVNCLSGYVICKSGKVLIFSFMHNNFLGSSKPWKMEMQRLLELIHRDF